MKRSGKSKTRLDELLVERGYCPSRERAKRMVIEGKVKIPGYSKPVKPANCFDPDVTIQLVEAPPYVSRGGEKLEKALREFSLDPAGLVFADIGASTGGFTDCLLQHGASRVYAIDVGYGQLHEKVRSDPRVVVRDRTNARYLTPDDFPELMDGVVVDVSFISLRLLFSPIYQILKPGGVLLTLIKPQFEVGKSQVGKRGIVKRKELHCQVLNQIVEAANENSFVLKGLAFSPLTGAKGNIEFLAYWRKAKRECCSEREWGEIIAQLVEETHRNFGV